MTERETIKEMLAIVQRVQEGLSNFQRAQNEYLEAVKAFNQDLQNLLNEIKNK